MLPVILSDKFDDPGQCRMCRRLTPRRNHPRLLRPAELTQSSEN
jgi:hypothetical protein